jgi:hypothetical protein
MADITESLEKAEAQETAEPAETADKLKIKVRKLDKLETTRYRSTQS